MDDLWVEGCAKLHFHDLPRKEMWLGRIVRGDGVPWVPAAVCMYDGCVQWVCRAGEGAGGWVVKWIDTGWRGRCVACSGKQGVIPEKGGGMGCGGPGQRLACKLGV